jgi:hypothetical protein
VAPTAQPTDAPAVLEAKADILSDQARRLTAQAVALDRAAAQLRTRETLRRRAGQMDRDPFASLDSSKRFMIVQGGGRSGTAVSGDGAKRGNTGAADTAVTRGAAPGAATPPPPPPGGPAPTASPGFAPPPEPPGGGDVPPPTGPITPPAAATPAGRALLDPAAMAELRRLEASGKSLSELEKLERASAALQARARSLEADARALRARATKP